MEFLKLKASKAVMKERKDRRTNLDFITGDFP
jgi:hypothetical protein